MADSLFDLLKPHLEGDDATAVNGGDRTASVYLSHLASLHLSEIDDAEPSSLATSLRSVTRNLQSLSNKTHRGFAASAEKLASLISTLPKIVDGTAELQTVIPAISGAGSSFAAKYGKSSRNELLDRRKQMLLLARNSDRLADIIDLPNLLSSSISSAGSLSGPAQSNASVTNYGTALDLYGHIKRLKVLYASSKIVDELSQQADEAIGRMTGDLIATLRQQNLKLAGGLRTIGWLRRVAPKLTKTPPVEIQPGDQADEDLLATLYLICRLHSLQTTLSALDPLRELADRETQARSRGANGTKEHGTTSAAESNQDGQQTIKYLKRYIEIFRDQGFTILSTYKGIFPKLMPDAGLGDSPAAEQSSSHDGDSADSPPPIATYSMHLLGILADTLRTYLPNVRDPTARESLLTQVLYCANSLGRLGADFGMLLVCLDEETSEAVDLAGNGGTSVANGDEEAKQEDPEWIRVMLKHRELSGRLELLASGLQDQLGTAAVSVW